ncbi:hypothetical protein B0H12DRAFT_1072243 [Mycena haematopus]|nr:hypothetical protein B0H12DRAFT_1072243 [Mycena haematopus]
MSFFTAFQDAPSPLLPSLLLAFVAAIPNHTVRYSGLCLIAILTVLGTIHLKSPLSQLRQLGTMIDGTDELLRRAMAQCPRDYITLTEQMGYLLEANRIASQIKCRILSYEGAWWFNWNNYRILSKDTAACAKRVKTIRTAIWLITEAEHQRKVEADINEIQIILGVTAVSSASHARDCACRIVYDG